MIEEKTAEITNEELVMIEQALSYLTTKVEIIRKKIKLTTQTTKNINNGQ